MKKLILLLMLMPTLAFAAVGDNGYEGGISGYVPNQDEMDYKEVVLVSGTPIIFEGTVEVKASGGKEDESATYKYTLTNDKDTLVREVILKTESEEKPNGQTLKNTSIEKFTETVTIGGTAYRLDHYDLTKTAVHENRPIGDYFRGNLTIRKEYAVGSNKIPLIIEGNGTFKGYDNWYTSNETMDMDYVVSYIDKSNPDASFTGKANVLVSGIDTKKIISTGDGQISSSIDQGYMLIENSINKLEYETEFPEFAGNRPTDYIIKKKDAVKYETFPQKLRLPIYTIQGIRGHWAEADLRKAFSMDIMDEWDSTTTANRAVTRGEFTKILALALKKEISEVAEDAKAVYRDVKPSNKYYRYIKFLTDEGVIVGVGSSKFNPNETITRAEAITMIVRALGFQDNAPEPLPYLNFNDRDDIPNWSAKFIYVGNSIGMINGDEYQNVNARKALTKGEIATMVIRFIEYLNDGLEATYLY